MSGSVVAVPPAECNAGVVEESSNVSLLAQSSFELGNATFSRSGDAATLVLVSLTVDELENVRSFSV